MKLVGFKNFTSKKNGQNYTVANCIGEFTEMEKQAGCIGQKIEEIFLPTADVGTLTEKNIGHDVTMQFEYSSGRAYLTDFKVL